MKGAVAIFRSTAACGARLSVLCHVVLFCFVTGCATSRPSAERAEHIHVLQRGWHTGVVIAREDIPPGAWPSHRDFAHYRYIEVGWGDDGFYRAERVTAPIALRALFLPTPSALHVIGFDGPPAEQYPRSRVIRVAVSPDELLNLCRFIENAYQRDETGEIIPLGPGHIENSWFYSAQGSYFLHRSCNHWTAQALRAAGRPAIPVGAVTAGCLMFQANRFGTTIQLDRDSPSPREGIR